MILSKHIQQRMRERNISNFIIELIMKIGDFNANCQRLIIDNHHKEQLIEVYKKLQQEESMKVSSIRELYSSIKCTENEEDKKNFIIKRRAMKKSIKETNKNLKELEKVLKNKYTLVMLDKTLVTVF